MGKLAEAVVGLAVIMSTFSCFAVAGDMKRAATATPPEEMPMIAVQFTIRDYAKFRSHFDKEKPLRDKAGIVSSQIFRGADNDKEILVLSGTTDLEKAREAIEGQEIRNAMREAGVVGNPKVFVVP